MAVRNWLKFILISATSCALSIGCTRKVEQATQVRIAFPPAQSVMMQSVSAYTANSVWQGSAPSTGSDVNCYIVAVSSTDGLNGANRCFRLDNSNVFATSMLHGAFPAGTTQEITVKSGSNRTIYLIGLRASNINECKLIGGTASGLDTASLSAPIILASQTLDLTSGAATAVNFTVPSSLSNTTTFENCSPMSLYVPSSVPAFSVTSVAPPYGPIAGGTSITLTGVGFTTGTTFTIGGSTCTSPTYVSSTQMTCTTPTLSTGAKNVVATRPSDSQTATLTNGFNAYGSSTVSVADISVYEYDTNAIVTVSLTAAMPMNTTVNYTTNASTATAGSDFTASSGSVTIIAGTTSQTITVPIINDATTESAEMFNVQISLPGGSPLTLGVDYSDITITDDDVPTAVLTISDGPTYNYAGTIYNGGTRDKTFTITNTGTVATGTISGSTTGEFGFKGGTYPGSGGNCPVSNLAGSATCTIVVTFAPLGPSTRTGSVDLAYNDGVAPQTVSRPMTGPGVAQGVLNITNGPTYDYGTVAIGAEVDMTFTLSNSGGTTINAASSASLSPPFSFKTTGTFPGSGGDCGSTITVPCTIVVTYSPTSVGVDSDTIDISYNNGLGTVSSTRDITGTGANPAYISISDGTVYNYGSVRTGSSYDKQFTLTNSGGVDANSLVVSSLTAPYSFKGGTFPGTGGDCGTVLAPSSYCYIVVSFSPTAAGFSSDTISVSYWNGISTQSPTRGIQGSGYMNMFYVTTTGTGEVERFQLNANGTLSLVGQTSLSPDGTSPNHVTVSPNDEFLYVSLDDTSKLKSFTIDSSGDLTPLNVSTFGSVLSPLIFDLLGRWLMFGTASSAGIEVMDWNSSTGNVTTVSGSPFTAANQIGTPAFHPSLDVVFITGRSTGAVKSFTINGIGQLAAESTAWDTTYPTSVAVHSNGTWVYVASEDGYAVKRYNYTAGSPGTLGSIAATQSTQNPPIKLLFHPNLPNVLYALSTGGSGPASAVNVYSVDGIGDLSHHSFVNLSSTNVTDMMIDSSGSFLLTTDCENGRVRMYSIDGSGGLTLVDDYSTLGTCATGISEALID